MFDLNDSETEKLTAWMLEQEKKFPRDEHGFVRAGCCGGIYTYSFTPTTLGTVAKVYCELTKETLNLTDYSMW